MMVKENGLYMYNMHGHEIIIEPISDKKVKYL
jgi:hypothetical protein